MCLLEEAFAQSHSHDHAVSETVANSHSDDAKHSHSQEKSSKEVACCKDILATHAMKNPLSVSLTEAPLKLSESFLTEFSTRLSFTACFTFLIYAEKRLVSTL